MGKNGKNGDFGGPGTKSGDFAVFEEYVRPSAFTFSNYFGKSVFD